MTTYERPDYAVRSMEQHLASIRGRHLTADSGWIRLALQSARDGELQSLRNAVDGKLGSHEFWNREGFRTIEAAWNHEYRLALFAEALRSSKFSHVRSGRDISPTTHYVYAADPTSPSGKICIGSMGFCPEATALIQKRGRVGATAQAEAR